MCLHLLRLLACSAESEMTEALLAIRPQVLLLLVVPQRDKETGNQIHGNFLAMLAE